MDWKHRPVRMRRMANEPDSESLVEFLQRLQPEQLSKANWLFELYFEKLCAVARNRLADLPNPADQAQDVALSVFRTFVRRRKEGQFSRIDGPDGLAKLLITITTRKAISLLRRERLRTGVQIGTGNDSTAAFDILSAVLNSDPTAEDLCVFKDLLEQIPEANNLRRVVEMRLAECSNQEIADKLDVDVRTVDRKFGQVRKLLEPLLKDLPPEGVGS